MYPLFETIRLEANMVLNTTWHYERMARSAGLVFNKEIKYFDSLDTELSALRYEKRHRCKLYYNQQDYKLEISEYKPKEASRICLISENEVTYSLKYTDRKCIEKHTEKLNEGDIPVFVKDKYLTDSSYANIALWNGHEWHTPDTPLLQGTKRGFLLEKKMIKTATITLHDLGKYQKLMLINAMLDWEEIVINLKELDINSSFL